MDGKPGSIRVYHPGGGGGDGEGGGGGGKAENDHVGSENDLHKTELHPGPFDFPHQRLDYHGLEAVSSGGPRVGDGDHDDDNHGHGVVAKGDAPLNLAGDRDLEGK